MKNENVIFEVKTEWTKNNNGYVRQVINYNCLPTEELKDINYAIHFINEISNYQEYANNIDINKSEIRVIDAITKEEINTKNDFINTILSYTKFQWNIED